jgi:hypothetical protein
MPNLDKSSSGRTFQQFAPKAISWINTVLNLQLDDDCFLSDLLADGTILCRLAVQMYPKIKCHLLQKGPGFTVHRIVFFLEFMKSLNIKPAMMFNISDVIIPHETKEFDNAKIKSALTILRTICACKFLQNILTNCLVERQARKKGWKGPSLKLNPSDSRKKSKKKSDLVEYVPKESFLDKLSAGESMVSTVPENTWQYPEAETPPLLPPVVSHLSVLPSDQRPDSFFNYYDESTAASPALEVIEEKEPRGSVASYYKSDNLPPKTLAAAIPSTSVKKSSFQLLLKSFDFSPDFSLPASPVGDDVAYAGDKESDAIEAREIAIHRFLKNEQAYLDGLEGFIGFLNSIIQRRKAASNRASQSITASSLDLTLYAQVCQ